MICMKCQQEGKRSTIQIGVSTRTLMGWQPYYDEDGRLHNKDPNKTTTYYSCSNGHQWTDTK